MPGLAGKGVQGQSPETVIDAGQREHGYWREVWRYRELLYFLARRDIAIRYRQTVLGIAWVLLRPLLTVVVFTVVFGRLAGFADGTMPYSLVILAGILPWQLCASALVDSGNSVVNNGSLISKVYFPRLIIPLSSLLASLVDFFVVFLLYLLLMIWNGMQFHTQILLLPFYVLLCLATSFGIGLWVASLNVRYRDFRIIATVLVQLGLYVSPVGFSSAVIPEKWRLIYSLNPMVGIIDGFRWTLLGDQSSLYWPGLMAAIAVSFILLVSSIVYFRASEKHFADEI
jgi:lipopolysaccharide transport system permease protein